MHVLPGRERIVQSVGEARIKSGFGPDQTVVERGADGFFHKACSDKDQLLAPVAPDWAPIPLKQRCKLRMPGPMSLRNGDPPHTFGFDPMLHAGNRQKPDPVRPGCQPEMALCPDETRPLPVQEVLKFGGIEGLPRTVNEAGYAIFFRFGHMVSPAV